MIGIGGSGINIINKAVSEQISEIEFVGIDTDEKALQLCNSPNIIQVEKSFASYFKSESEQKAVDDNVENIRELIKEADVVFICCGMGGRNGNRRLSGCGTYSKRNGNIDNWNCNKTISV